MTQLVSGIMAPIAYAAQSTRRVSSAAITTGSCAMLIGAGSAGVVAVTGGMSVASVIKDIAISESGYYTN